VHRVKRSGAIRQPLGHANAGREGLRRLVRELPGSGHQLADTGSGQFLRGRVDGHQAGRMHRPLPRPHGLVLGHPELVALLERSVEPHPRALPKLASDPGLVEPDGHNRPRLVKGPDLHALLPAVAHGPHGRASDRDLDRGFLAHAERGDLAHLATVPMRVGEVLDQIPERGDPEDLRAFAGGLRQRQRGGEPRGMRERAQGRAQRLLMGQLIRTRERPR
jgi:hypothetical protein